MVVKPHVTQQHTAAQNQRCGVGLILAPDVKSDVTAAWFEYCYFATHIAAWHKPRPTDQTGADVGQDTAVQVRHDHNIKLLWPADTLHAGIVDNHVVGLDRRVLLPDLLDRVAKESIRKLHDIGLVHASDLLAVIGESKCKGKFGDALGLGSRDYLQRLDNTRD